MANTNNQVAFKTWEPHLVVFSPLISDCWPSVAATAGAAAAVAAAVPAVAIAATVDKVTSLTGSRCVDSRQTEKVVSFVSSSSSAEIMSK